jgi:hypothetical protein
MNSKAGNDTILKGGSPFYGVDVGIILLDAAFPRPPGDVAHAATFPFPVLYEVVGDATPRRVVEEAAEGLLAPFIDAVNRLVDRGVRGIATCCGFLAIYQQELAAKSPVPVATSSLLQIPQVLRTIGTQDRIGVLTINSATLDERHFSGVGVTSDERARLTVIGLEETKHIYPTIIGEGEVLDVALAETEVVKVAAEAIARDPAIGAFVLECTNLPPYAAAVQAATGRPVFDAVTLITWLRNAVRQRGYTA